jgi:hypothetical protein
MWVISGLFVAVLCGIFVFAVIRLKVKRRSAGAAIALVFVSAIFGFLRGIGGTDFLTFAFSVSVNWIDGVFHAISYGGVASGSIALIRNMRNLHLVRKYQLAASGMAAAVRYLILLLIGYVSYGLDLWVVLLGVTLDAVFFAAFAYVLIGVVSMLVREKLKKAQLIIIWIVAIILSLISVLYGGYKYRILFFLLYWVSLPIIFIGAATLITIASIKHREKLKHLDK